MAQECRPEPREQPGAFRRVHDVGFPQAAERGHVKVSNRMRGLEMITQHSDALTRVVDERRHSKGEAPGGSAVVRAHRRGGSACLSLRLMRSRLRHSLLDRSRLRRELCGGVPRGRWLVVVPVAGVDAFLLLAPHERTTLVLEYYGPTKGCAEGVGSAWDRV